MLGKSLCNNVNKASFARKVPAWAGEKTWSHVARNRSRDCSDREKEKGQVAQQRIPAVWDFLRYHIRDNCCRRVSKKPAAVHHLIFSSPVEAHTVGAYL